MTNIDSTASIDKLSTSVAQLSIRVEKFAQDVTDAQQDMGSLSEQIAHLEDCLDELETKFTNPAGKYSDRQRKNLNKILGDCDRVSKEMITLLISLAPNNTSTSVSWSGFPRERMLELQDDLEALRHVLRLGIDLKQVPSPRLEALGKNRDSTADTESMLSIHQSFLETQPVPYAKEDPTYKPGEPPAPKVETVNPSNSGMADTSTPHATDHPPSQPSKRNTLFDNRFDANESPKSDHSVAQQQHVEDDGVPDGLIVVPIELTQESAEKEVVPSNFSMRSANTFTSESEFSAREPLSMQLGRREFDEIAMTAAAKHRSRLTEPEQDKKDKELLKRVKEGASLSAIESLLDHGADPNASGPRNTVLSTEIQYSRRRQVVELLLRRGVDPNATSDGIPAHKILEGGNLDRWKSKLGVGTSVDAVPHQVGILYIAALHSDIEMVKLLISYGATLQPNLKPLPAQGRSFSISGRPTIDRKNSFGLQVGAHFSAILVAAEGKKWDVVEFLLQHGANPNETGGKFHSTLHIATAQNKKDIMQLLIYKGADVNLQGGEYGSALIAAAYECHPTAAGILLDAGADINRQSKKYGTALNAAVLNGYFNVVKLLLERGADMKLGYVLDTALEMSKDDPENKNRSAIVRLLEAKGAKRGPSDKKVPEWAGLFSESY